MSKNRSSISKFKTLLIKASDKSSVLKKGFYSVLVSTFLAITSSVQAAGGGNVNVEFSSNEQLYLYVSLGFGILSLLLGFYISSSVMKQSAGSEEMQSVADAIKDGALAYLRKQVSAMSILVVFIAAGLFGLYQGTHGAATASLIAVSFIGGVIASYFAGYIGMLMAVNGNVRTANAALTSYKLSLETAFRSGAVAGLATIGMGIIGASVIFLLGGSASVKMLVGFGFGGSLAALFMRVGGGIYTKAADVGADLVGKVEAGIPEDDPRNPATIADNVGDNVGDCAGMAADVFESYVVTLVAAIVLGATTSEIFEQDVWMRLVLFAFMVKGIGILSSIVGILTFKGSDDLNSDPLSAIRLGFKKAVLLCIAGTGVAAWYMFDGEKGGVISSKLVPVEAFQKKDAMLVAEVKLEQAKHKNVHPDKIVVNDIVKNPKLIKKQLTTVENKDYLASLLSIKNPEELVFQDMKNFKKLDLNENKEVADKYSVSSRFLGIDPADKKVSEFISLGEALKAGNLNYYKLSIKKVNKSKDDPTKRSVEKPREQSVIMFDKLINKIIDEKKKADDLIIDVIEHKPVEFYLSKDNAIVAAVSGLKRHDARKSVAPLQLYAASATDLNKVFADANKAKDFTALRSLDKHTVQPQLTVIKHKSVDWWRFFLCVAFGLFMAFAIELLTDYYVSTNRKPVQEVAGVSTAGAAPMLIQGFSYALESSVFSVFAIVLALIAPMVIFPPSMFDGYILSLYGVALVGLGLLSTTGYILAMDTFGPIADNAQGIFEMSGAGKDNPKAARAVGLLDAAGNTTKALTKGFAIATAVVAAVALFQAYIQDTHLENIGIRANIPEIFMGILLGGATPYLFSAFSISAVGRAAFHLIGEVRRQFKADPGIMAGTSRPDYGRCVEIVTAAAQKELIGPAILAICMPIVVGFGFSIGKDPVIIGGERYNLVGAEALGGFLIGAIVSGQLLAVLLANSGGMWDNAKKLIEDGHHGGKGSDAHKASVVCDTVGDPFKDTAGPALNPLIKVMNLVAVLLAPIIVQPLSTSVLVGVTGVSGIFLIGAMVYSKKGSMSDHFKSMSSSEN